MSNALSNASLQKSAHHIFKVDTIKIGKRFRKDSGDLTALCTSIRQHGLLHPIVVDESMTLIAGFRRLTAFKELGLTYIPVHFINELDELQMREIELDENIQRKDMHWSEIDKLRTEILRVKQLLYGTPTATKNTAHMTPASQAAPATVPVAERPPGLVDGFSMKDAADSQDISLRTYARSVARDHAMKVIPGLAQAATAKEAERKARTLIEDLERELVVRQIEKQKAADPTSIDRLILGDVCDELAKLDPGSIDCCIADPPYGINAGSNEGWRQEAGFDDDPVSALALLRATLREVQRVLRPNAHLYLFFPIIYYGQVCSFLRQAQLQPDEIPLVWVKDQHGTVDWSKRFAPSYESILFCSDGTRSLGTKRINVFTYPTDKTKEHPFQKPVQLLRELLELSSKSQEVVLDLFGGSGSTSIAAKQLGRHFIYIDNDLRSLDIAKANLARVQRGSHEVKGGII